MKEWKKRTGTDGLHMLLCEMDALFKQTANETCLYDDALLRVGGVDNRPPQSDDIISNPSLT